MLSRPLIAPREAYNGDFTGKKQGGRKGSIISWNGTEPSAFIRKRAEDMTPQRWEELGQTQHAMWADNMFPRYLLTDPMRSNVSADLSVIMVVPTRRRLPVFVGRKHIADVQLLVNSTATLVQQCVPHLLQGIRLTLRNIKREFLHIPLDIVRPVVKPLHWKPLAVLTCMFTT